MPAASEAFHSPSLSATASADEPSWIDIALTTVMTTAIPALVLFAVMAAGYAYRDVPFSELNDWMPGTLAWLPVGAIAIPASFLIVHLVNRRYGAVPALIQIGFAWAIVAVAALGPALGLPWQIPAMLDVPPHIALAMAASLAFAQAAAAITFAGARTWRWWTAPFNGSFWGSAIFSVTFFPASYLLADLAWPARMAEFFLLSLGGSVVLLIAYWMVRPLIQPLPNFGGY